MSDMENRLKAIERMIVTIHAIVLDKYGYEVCYLCSGEGILERRRCEICNGMGATPKESFQEAV